MRNLELERRAEELYRRCLDQQIVTHTGFLSPAEQYVLSGLPHLSDRLHLHGGAGDSERCVAFFLPDYLTATSFEPAEYLCAFHLTCRFAKLLHRDVLGAVLGLGIERWCLGDIMARGEEAWFFCLPTVVAHIQRELTKVGRHGAMVRELSLSLVPPSERRVEAVHFSVSSLRLDSLLAGTFGLSRTQAAFAAETGLVQLNYAICTKPAMGIEPGDVFSLRGGGKARLAELGGLSRKSRLFVRVDRYV